MVDGGEVWMLKGCESWWLMLDPRSHSWGHNSILATVVRVREGYKMDVKGAVGVG